MKVTKVSNVNKKVINVTKKVSNDIKCQQSYPKRQEVRDFKGMIELMIDVKL